MIRILWPSGECHAAKTWEALETAVREAQWSEYTPREFRTEMLLRADAWSGVKRPVSLRASSEDFMRGLADVEMCIVIET